jgi:hypothetical protein
VIAVRPKWEVADVIRRYGQAFLDRRSSSLSFSQQRALRELALCRTAALGGHVEECSSCAHRVISYNSCRNRHCPKCQGSQRAAWLDQQMSQLLPVEYHHVVFTLPAAVAEVVFQNQKLGYTVLFRAASETLKQIAADPKHLGAEIGFTAVLHTWGQALTFHPHLHCLATGGGLTPDDRWVSTKPGFFLPVRVLSQVFRGKFLAELTRAWESGELRFFGDLAGLSDASTFAAWRAEQACEAWCVHSKPPVKGPEVVLKYLARYVDRVAISNHRLVSLENGEVTFRYKDYRQSGRDRQKTMTLPAEEFLRRFVMHVLPPGFQKVRSYGLLANTSREQKLSRCREELAVPLTVVALAPPPQPSDAPACPQCGQTTWHQIEWTPCPSLPERLGLPIPRDTS